MEERKYIKVNTIVALVVAFLMAITGVSSMKWLLVAFSLPVFWLGIRNWKVLSALE